jgi:hypothetical protein
MRIFEELVLGGGIGLVAHLRGPIEHAAQHAARADFLRLVHELAEEEQHPVLERDLAAGFGNHAHPGIGIGGMPARVLHVVEQLVVAVPAQHHVAEAETVLERREELRLRYILAAQDGVAVEHADLDVGQAALLHDLLGVSKALHLLRLQRHDVTPRSVVLICPFCRLDLYVWLASRRRADARRKDVWLVRA